MGKSVYQAAYTFVLCARSVYSGIIIISKLLKLLKGKIMSENNEIYAVIDTSKGKIRLKLFADEAPFTVANFVNLAKNGFYSNLKFHRVIEDFMIQGGCPQGSGMGGPGYKFEDEFSDNLRHDKGGILSMANSGPDSNGSQFFITHVATPWLDNKHSVFGEVASDNDMAVVNSIKQNDKINDIIIEGDLSELSAKTKTKVDEWNRILQ